MVLRVREKFTLALSQSIKFIGAVKFQINESLFSIRKIPNYSEPYQPTSTPPKDISKAMSQIYGTHGLMHLYVMQFASIHLCSIQGWLKSKYLPSRHHVDMVATVPPEGLFSFKLVERPSSGVQWISLYFCQPRSWWQMPPLMGGKGSFTSPSESGQVVPSLRLSAYKCPGTLRCLFGM